MNLWLTWMQVLSPLRGAFSRQSTFFSFLLVIAGFTLRQDKAGVTSFVRCLGVRSTFYHSFLRFFHSSAVCLDTLIWLWVEQVVGRLPGALRVNNRRIVLLDGIGVPKEGRRMPGVKKLHDASSNTNRAEFFDGHYFQALAMVFGSFSKAWALPLTAQIHQGLELSFAAKHSLLDKAVDWLRTILSDSYYLVADAYYGNGKFVSDLVQHGHHLITRIKNNAVAYMPLPETAGGQRSRGRPAKFGAKVVLLNFFSQPENFLTTEIELYGEKMQLRYLCLELINRPAQMLIRYVLVQDVKTNRRWILMCSDLECSPEDIIRVYGIRFKIEGMFRTAKQIMHVFGYHFWSKAMDKLSRTYQARKGCFDDKTDQEQTSILGKVSAYHLFVQCGLIAQGALLILANLKSDYVWQNHNTWLRTVRDVKIPSIYFVISAMQSSFPVFFHRQGTNCAWLKFIRSKIDPIEQHVPMWAKEA